MRRNNSNLKILILSLFAIGIGGIISFSVLFTTLSGIHIRSGINVLEAKAGSQEKIDVIRADRGKIKDRNGNVIAQNNDTYTIVAILSKDRPGDYAYVEDREFTAKALSPILKMSEEEIMEYLNLQDEGQYQTYFGDKGRNLTIDQKKKIDAIVYTPDSEKETPGLPGIEFEKTVTRVYSPGRFASTLIGFASFDSEQDRIVGKVGLESYLDDVLVGKDGRASSKKDGKGYTIPGTEKTLELATNGSDVYLTIDKEVQEVVEEALRKTVKTYKAKMAWAVVMEVETGKILGYGGYPTYDLNSRDKIVSDIPSTFNYETGSTIKPFVYASAIEEGVYDGKATVNTGRFCYVTTPQNTIKHTGSDCPMEGAINDAYRPGWGTITLNEGLVRSSNTAVATILTKYLDVDVYWDYLDKLGFFKPTGIEGMKASEESGWANNTYAIDKLSMGFGQGSSVTALQMLQAYTAIFNDGKMVKPYYIDKIVDANNNIVHQGKTEYVHKDKEGNPIPIYSKETTRQVMDLMKEVIQNQEIGTGKEYNIPEYDMIAKTGTGEIANSGTYGNVYTSNVMAAAPADDPKVMVYYGFQASQVGGFDGSIFKSVFRAAYEAMGLEKTETSNTDTTYDDWNEYDMPTFKNHTFDYVEKKLKAMDVNPIIIGDGKVVVDQYPTSNNRVVTNQNVFIKTNSSNINMPNMVGWSYKDVMIFKELSGLDIECKGSGVVKSQSVKAKTKVNNETKITVELK